MLFRSVSQSRYSYLTQEQEEAEIQRAAQALENVRQRQEELEKNASQMMAHGGLVLERIEAADELSRRVTERDLIIYVQDFLNQHVPGHRFQQNEIDNTFLIQLPASAAADLDDFCRRKGLIGQTSLGNALPRQCRFVNKLTSVSNKLVENIHQFHPLIRYISQRLNELEEAFYPLVSVKVSASEMSIAPGDYMFALRRWTFSGVRDEEWLQSAVCELSTRMPLPDELAESLINQARIHGGDWLEAPASVSPEVASACLDELEAHLEQSYQRAKKRKQDENADRLMFQLHGIDHDGEFSEPDMQNAAMLFQQAAHLGHASAAFNLAHMYKRGALGKTDIFSANKWFSYADQLNHPHAYLYLPNKGIS